MTVESTSDTPISPNMISVCLDHLVRTLAGRRGCEDAERIARSSGTKMLIQAINPKTGLELVLAGHAVMFLSLAAVTAEDLVAQTDSPGAARTRSAVIAMGRIAAKNMDALVRLRLPPGRKAKAAAPASWAPAAAEPDADMGSAAGSAGPVSQAAPMAAETSFAPEQPAAAEPAQPPVGPRPSREMRRRAKQLALRSMRAAGMPPSAISKDALMARTLQIAEMMRG